MRTGSRWRHKKRGTSYEVLGRAAMQISIKTLFPHGHRTTPLILEEVAVASLEKMSFVAYRSEADDTLWVRPESEFLDGRFEEIKP